MVRPDGVEAGWGLIDPALGAEQAARRAQWREQNRRKRQRQATRLERAAVQLSPDASAALFAQVHGDDTWLHRAARDLTDPFRRAVADADAHELAIARTIDPHAAIDAAFPNS
jgi:hypothetical protein